MSDTHNGRSIVGKKIEIRQTGGEFSKDLLVANADELDDITVGSERTLAVRVVCVDEHYPAENRKEPSDGGVTHKLVFDPTEVTIIAPELVESMFVAQREKVQAIKDSMEGQTTLDGEAKQQAHDAGTHADGLVDGCPACDAEKALATDELGAKRGRTRTTKS